MESFKTYLHGRGITDEAIIRYGISGDSEKITIPIQGFNKYRTYPKKRYFYDKGFQAALFGLQQLEGSKWCVLTEGELDALRLASEGIPATSGTGGAGTFKDEWITQLPKYVFICYDTDIPGRDNALKIHWKIPNSKIIYLPQGKDVTEYLTNHSKTEFEELIKNAVEIPKPPPVITFRAKKKTDVQPKVKEVPITDFIQFRMNKAKCIWHNESTPSLHYYPETNRIFCFGCNKWGDVIDVVQQLKGISYKEAVTLLT